ncbi:MAG: putative anti-sigma factor antagonist [Alphaproteobacteria bacterium MarineAlpha3_Bin5]|nr:MAG: putative anti-sigma factor antagonist [Alphaproteobacteria bacterium MarineAlpha3_Bin5]
MMEYEVEERSNTLIIRLTGDIDLQTSPNVRQGLMGSIDKGRPIIVDLSGVDYIDSSGVASLVESLQTMRKKGKQFILVSVSEKAMRVFQLARLDKVFTICSDLDEGLKIVKGE